MREIRCNSSSGTNDAVTDVLTFLGAGATASFVDDLLFGNDDEGVDGDDVPRGMAVSRSQQRADALDRGTIYMCIPYILARCQARPTKNLPPSQYLVAAVAHAQLHALGFDHETPEELREMVKREQRLGRQLRALARQHPSLLPPMDALEYMRNARI